MLYSPSPLHIPDGFLSLAISLIFWAITLVILSTAVKRTETLDEKQVPLMGVMAAFIFAAQMINFPVAGGTSGHLLGGALAAIMLGPWAGMLVMTAVVAVQGLLFQDGGLLVMGANIFNMGLLTAAIGFGFYKAAEGRQRKLKLFAAGLGAWLSVMAGALFTALQLWLSGTARLDIVLPAMLGVHAVIGIGEVLITVAAIAFIFKTRPDLLEESESSAQNGRGWIVVGALLSLGVVLLSPFASADPDGLERVATDLGFLEQGANAPYKLLSDYALPFFRDSAFSTIAAGLIGILVIAALVIFLARRRSIRHTSHN
jgi:cobalt/nickel transport system permease protein